MSKIIEKSQVTQPKIELEPIISPKKTKSKKISNKVEMTQEIFKNMILNDNEFCTTAYSKIVKQPKVKKEKKVKDTKEEVKKEQEDRLQCSNCPRKFISPETLANHQKIHKTKEEKKL